ncbi:DUF3168 domain-containing protein [Jannaschia rubra]|uniref:DUF3168 domain-containing protein n=1 Tax=Jannaschia rubra TaxID=282197 RepID=UPI0024900328|nr:DUF3168 domain-containing protein [Jannaschia rubra]
MTYAMGESLQAAVFERMANDAGIGELARGAVFDAAPMAPPDLFVALGPERTTGRSDVTGRGAIHQFRISVVTRREGFMDAKALAARVSNALDGADLTLTRGRLVSMRFVRAEARRDKGAGARRIDLWFRARLDDDGSDDINSGETT